GFERYVDCTSYAAMMDGKPTSEWAMDKDVMAASHRDDPGEDVLRVQGLARPALEEAPLRVRALLGRPLRHHAAAALRHEVRPGVHVPDRREGLLLRQ